MTDKSYTNIAEIEDAQAGLRDSIAVTQEMAERTEDLLQRHRAGAERESAESNT